MALKRKIAQLEDVAEEHRELYRESDDGSFVFKFDVEDSGSDRARVGEFRDRNIALDRDMKALKAKYAGVDPEAFRSMEAQLAAGEEKKLLGEGKIEELVALRTNRFLDEHKREVEAMKAAGAKQTEREAGLVGQLSGFMIDRAAGEAIGESARIRSGAESDFAARARGTFRFDAETGTIRPDAAGKMEYGANGEALTIGEWAQGQVKTAGHLFEASGGGGAGGSELPAGGGVRGSIPDDPEEFGRNIEDIASGKMA